ncbi:anti-sigma factor [Kitasatospora nipponensis]|uniref:Regulator of SigK n=1 Tax=Kitasatospora nipponensis TaxID=258049 RepID=A0ABN1WWG4_9ACTN
MTIAPDLHTLTGAYAAHALPEAERRQFEGHLATCDACAQEVREFTATLARLGAAEALTPPPELKVRVMGRIGSVRQAAPSPSGPGADDGRPMGPDGRPVTGRGRAGRRAARFALAASVALAALLGGIAYQQHDQAHQARSQVAQLQEQQARFSSLLTAPDARTSTASAGAAVGTVVWSPSRGQAGFLASGLPALSEGKTYELWFDDAGTMRPAGLLPASSGALLLSGPVNGAVGVGVTLEPAGGSPHPTSAPMMLLPMT